MKLGKREPRPKPTDFKLRNYIVALPVPASTFGFGKLYSDWHMLGNSDWGDCVEAGAAHETMVYNKLRKGIDVPFDDKSVLSDYSAITGFDPSKPNSDQGTYVADEYSFRLHTGALDANGNRHKIAAYVQIDPKDFDLMIQAAFVFGCVGIGFEFPDSAWKQFDDGKPWDVTGPNVQIDGGHYVPIVGSSAPKLRATCITWGKRQEMTKAFYQTYNDEAWVPLSEEQIRTDGTGIHGLNWAALQADLAAL